MARRARRGRKGRRGRRVIDTRESCSGLELFRRKMKKEMIRLLRSLTPTTKKSTKKSCPMPQS